MNTRYTTFETHYYKETARLTVEITDPSTQKKIDEHMKTHHMLPPDGTARETGFSSLLIDDHNLSDSQDVVFNPSMVKKKSPRTSSSAMIISRLKNAPELPLSCLASAEHVVAMQNRVTNFIDESIPAAAKNQVVYQILVRSFAIGISRKKEIELLLATISRFDDQIDPHKIMINYHPRKKLFVIEIGTQIGDIQKTLRGIRSLKHTRIINCELNEIGLNEGVCLVKGDSSNPIHALVNIAKIGSKTLFLERDAGLTSGLKTSRFQDNRWTFNHYDSLKSLQKRAGYTDKSSAVKIYLKP